MVLQKMLAIKEFVVIKQKYLWQVQTQVDVDFDFDRWSDLITYDGYSQWSVHWTSLGEICQIHFGEYSKYKNGPFHPGKED